MTSAANTTPVRLAGPSLLHELLSDVPATADRQAIDALLSDGTRVQLSYSELHAQADALSKRLLHHISGSEFSQVVVPVLLRQAPDLYVALLAILKSGAAFCPLNLDAPPERVKFIVRDVGAAVLLTTSDLTGRVPPDLGAMVVVLDQSYDEIEVQHSPLPATEKKLAYVMYTSGSTGTPKGVGVSHGAVTQSLLSHDKHIPQFDRFLQFAAPTFDVSVFEIFFPLFRGATLVNCHRAAMLNDLPEVIRQLEVDACELTPTVAGSLLRSREAAPCLKLLLTIGEMLSEPVITEFGGRSDRPSILWAMYGPTEAAIHCTLAAALSADASTGHIGIPLDTVSCFIISPGYKANDPESFKVLEVGEVGELVVGGYQNATGYLNRPEQTSQAFIDSPFGPVYRTGDLARMSPDGTFECLGRMTDGQVKLRGQRIELGEIEQAVLRTPGCHGVVAAVMGHILVAFCAVDSGLDYEDQVEAIREMCMAWLPSFMVPRNIVLMNEFPRLASGKVDRKRLKAEYQTPAFADEEVLEVDRLVARVKDVTKELLGDLGKASNLAAAGLDSLIAIKLASVFRKDGFDVSAMDMLRARTLADLCSAIAEKQSFVSPDEPPVLFNDDLEIVLARHEKLQPLRDDIAFLLPTTTLQAAMLAETSINPQAYCNEITISFPFKYGGEQVVEAFLKMAEQNEILRTGFIYDAERFLQVIFKTASPLQISVVSQFSEDAQLSDLLRPLRFEILDESYQNERQARLHIHHSVYDGWTLDMMLSDLDTILRGGSPEPRPQFAKFFSFQERLTEADLERSGLFWAEHLLGWQKVTFPKLARGSNPDNYVLTQTSQLRVKAEHVQHVTQSLNVSSQVLFQAALLWLWSGLLGTGDIVIGCVTSGRTIPLTGVERIMGPCIASSPLRADLSGVEKVKDLTNLVHASNRAMLQHTVLPLAEIKRVAAIASGDALYDILFVYQESLDSREEASVHEVSHRDFLETPILLEVEPNQTGFVCQMTYHTSLVPPSFAEAFLGQFDSVIQAMAQDTHAKLSGIREVFGFPQLSIYNPHAKHLAGCHDLASMVEVSAEKTPDKLAIHFARSIFDDTVEGETVSYSKFNRLANQMARCIASHEMGAKDSPVMVVMEKSPLLYASILGILKIARAYLPLLPSTPTARVQTIIDKAKVSLIVTDTATHESLETLSCIILNVETAALQHLSVENPSRPINPSRAAYVIYTSGTTGAPKGVVVTEQNMVSNLEMLRHIYPTGTDSRMLQACSQAFDVSVFEMFFAWMTGMCLCSAVNDILFEDLELAIRSLQVTHLSMTPTVAGLVRRSALPNVEFLVTAGEAMTQAVLDEWKGVLYQGYGPSETTNICTVKKMEDGDHIQHLGHAFENTSAFVLYPESPTPVPFGAVGELCFGGDQVAKGYLNEPDLTASKFVTQSNLGTIYRSGDLGRMLCDGSLIIMGRLDDQVKLRGQRIDVGEIESIVASTRKTSSCATTVIRRDDESPKQLALFYTHQEALSSGFRVLSPDDDSETRKAIFATLEAALPAYMIPSYLVPVSAVPRTASGKIDRQALAAAFGNITLQDLKRMSSRVDEEPVDSEWSGDEKQVADELLAALHLTERIGRWTPLAALGLDSITAISVAKHLSQVFDRRVAVSDILMNPTVAQLTARLVRTSQSLAVPRDHSSWFSQEFLDSVSKKFEGVGFEVEAVLPCTPLQEAMLATGSGSYYNRMLLHLKIPPRDLKAFWETMVERHGILRTCFVSTEDSERPFAQVVVKTAPLRWEMGSSDWVPDLHFAKMERAVGDPVDSMRPPLEHSVAFRDGTPLLFFLCHHAIYDGVAMSLLFEEVENLARGLELRPSVPYEPFLREALDLSPDTDDFWREKFQSFCPAKFSRSASVEMSQTTLSLRLDLQLKAMEEKAQSLGLSLLSVSQAAWASTLRIAMDEVDICFGNVVNGRTIAVEGIDRLVAPCFNTIPLRVNLSHQSQTIGLFRHLHRVNADAMKYQFTPLRRVQKLAGLQGLFETILLLQPPKAPINTDIWELISDDGAMDIPLVCEIVPDSDANKIHLNLHYDGFPRQFISALADAMNHILSFSIQFPSSTIPQLEDLPDHVQQAIRLVPVERDSKTGFAAAAADPNISWTDVELRMRRVLSQLGGIPETTIQRQTTIFQLGLDSINAVQIASILKAQGMNVTATDIIGYPTCAALASLLLEKQGVPTEPSEPTMSIDYRAFQGRVVASNSDIGDFEAILPCTPVQSAMLTEFVRSGGQNYFNYLHLVLEKDIPVPEVVASWQAVVATHPILRTGFTVVDDPDDVDTPYAMIKYGVGMREVPISVNSSAASKFSVGKWKLDARQAALQSLQEPPWRTLLLLDDSTGQHSMHLVLHHALYDAHSLDLMLDDLGRCMNGKKPVQQGSFVTALGTILELSCAKNQGPSETFWRAKADRAVVNSFPVMTPLRVERGEVLSQLLTASLSIKNLRHATQKANISVQAAIQAAWTRVLSSYLGEDSVIFGVVMSGRNAEIQDAVFPCIATVPVVAQNVKSNRELLRDMMELNKNLYEHQFSRLSDVQKWVGHPGTRLFDTLLVYQRGASGIGTPRPWRVERDDGFVDFPVSLEVEPVDGHIKLRITHRTDVVPQEQATIILQQFEGALKHLVVYPDGDEDGLWARSPHLFSVMPAIQSEIPSDAMLLHGLLELQVARQPEKVALEFVSRFGDDGQPITKKWSFAELDKIGNKVARHLKSKGVPAKSIVAIHFDKCPEAYFSILGILKAGCCFLALDPAAPEARKAFILEDSHATALLLRESSDLSFDTEVRMLEIQHEMFSALDICAETSASSPQETTPETILPSDPCYCLYTSGTTGMPKGCEITHENAVQAMMAFQGLFRGHWDTSSKWLQFASLHFDVSVLEQYWSWSVGMTVVATPRDLILDDIERCIKKLSITHIDLTPSLASLVKPENVPSLWKGVFITGGEQLKQDILDAWGPKGVIYNAYGPTEATIGVTMRQRVPSTGRPINIGHQFPNVGTYVFHQGTEMPVLKGGVGELCVSGKLVGKGYLNRPELTEERFPTLERFGERVYRTGDLVRLLSDASFDFLGRADDQVKLRGQRLQLGEINHAIQSGTPAVRDVATVVAKHGKTGKDLLVSFITSQPAKEGQSRGRLEVVQTADSARLCHDARAACMVRIPAYMVPTYVIELPYIPLSRNNKAELRDLSRLFESLGPELASRLSASDVPSDGLKFGQMKGVDKLTIEIISEFCRLDANSISLETSIFELGVDSITIPRLARALKRKGVKAATPETLLRHPKLGDLLASLASASTPDVRNLVAESRQISLACSHRYRPLACRELGIGVGDVEYVAPCTPLQLGIISRALAGDVKKGVYFNTFSFILCEATDLCRLRLAWEAVISENAILRTQFVLTPDGFCQVARRESNIRWTELEGEEADELIPAKSEKWIEANSSHITSPLEFFVSQHNRDGISKTRLTTNIFHAIYDGASFDLILQSVAAHYRSDVTVDAGPAFIDALPLGPLWKYDYCRQFWAEHLQNWRSVEVFLPGNQNGTGDAGSFAQSVVSHNQTEALDSVARSLGVTIQSVILALWVSTLRQFCPETTMGIVVSGRAIDVEGIEKTIGPLFNTVPFFAGKSPEGETFASLVQRCHQFSAAVSAFQHVPLKDIQRWCSGGKPLFDNLFAFQLAAEEPGFGDLWLVEDQPPRADYPLAFEATLKRSGELEVLLLTSSQTANEEGVRLALRQFQDAVTILLGQGEEGLQKNLSTIPLQDQSVPTTSRGQQRDPRWGHPSQQETEALPENLTPRSQVFLDEISDQSGVPLQDLHGGLSLTNLGLDSIDVVQLSARLKSRGVVLAARDMTHRQHLGIIVSLLQEENAGAQVELGQDPEPDYYSSLTQKIRDYIENHDQQLWLRAADVLPPTPLQEAMVSQMMQSGFRRYFNHDLLEVGSDIDIGKLMDAWETTYTRNTILRTIFVEVLDPTLDISFCQVVLRNTKLRISVRTLQSMEEVDSVIEDAKSTAAAAPGRSGLFQIHVLTVGKRRFVLLSIAHALYDGWSLALLHQDVEDAYNGKYIDRPPSADGLRRMITSGASARTFWSGYLADAEPTILPQRLANFTTTDNVHRVEATSTIRRSTIMSFSKFNGISLQVVGQACWAGVLASLSASLDLTFGVVLSGRDFDNAERIMLPTMNTVAVRSVLHGTAIEFLRYMEENMRSIRNVQSYPLRMAVAAAKGKPKQLFNTLFLFQKSPTEHKEGKPIMKSVESSATVEYPVCVEMEVLGEELVWRTACDGSVMSEEDASLLLHRLDQVLEYLLRHPNDKDVLAFDQFGVSICGLPNIQLAQLSQENEEASASPVDGHPNISWTRTEEIIREVLSEMSGVSVSDISKSASLYHLGLDSISAIKVAANLRARGVNLTVRQLLTANSVEEMGVSNTRGEKGPGTALTTGPLLDDIKFDTEEACRRADVSPDDVEKILPALPMQVYMLTTWQNSGGIVVFPSFRYNLTGPEDEAEIQKAWEACVAENEILRTYFVVSGGDWPILQLVLKGASAGATKRAMVGSHDPTQESSSFDGHELVQLCVTKNSSQAWILDLRIHHALYDAVSLSAIMRRLCDLCGDVPTTPDPGNARNIWEPFTARHASTSTYSERHAFWTNYLQGCQPLQPRSEQTKAAEATSRTSLFVPAAIPDVSRLKLACTKRGIPFQALFFAAYARVLTAQAYGVQSVAFGIYLANRSFQPDLPQVYPTLNLVPLNVAVQPELPILEVAAQVQRDLLAISEGSNATVGLWEVHRWTGVMIDSFVNFLGTDILETGSSRERTYSISLAGAPPPKHISKDFAVPGWLKDNPVAASYPDPIDIEASITSTGLNIGVFGTKQRVSKEKARQIVESIVEILGKSISG